MFILTEDLSFPPIESADESGFLAIGGDLGANRLLLAYRSGIFPWYSEDEPICWWSPDPRFVLFPGKLKISGSMKTVINSGVFQFSVDKNFSDVVKNCRLAKRKGEPGTWITDEIEKAYFTLFGSGFAHSAEAWHNKQLAGGLYGVQIGKVFFGESMFATQSNASKFAFIKYVQLLQEKGVEVIDCQVYTPHLESLGAEFISRKYFTRLFNKLVVK